MMKIPFESGLDWGKGNSLLIIPIISRSYGAKPEKTHHLSTKSKVGCAWEGPSNACKAWPIARYHFALGGLVKQSCGVKQKA